MPWRLLVFIAVFGLFLAFIAFNLDNRCDISFGFTVISDIPVFLTIFSSFVLGLVCTLPFVIRARKIHKALTEKERKPVKEVSGGGQQPDGGSDGVV